MKKSILLLTACVLSGMLSVQLKAQGNLDRTGWIADAFQYDGDNYPENVLDGNRFSRWSSGKVQEGGEWISVDMLELQTFNRLIIDNQETSNDYPRGYEIYVSDDGEDWGDPVISGEGKEFLTVINFPDPITARYIKIVQTGEVYEFIWWSMNELYVQLIELSSDIDRTAWIATASEFDNEDYPQNVVDNDLDTRWATGKNQEGGEWLAIDMREVQDFNQIILDNVNNANDFPREYEVYISNDGESWGNAVMAGAGTPGLTIIDFPENLSAQHVKILQTGLIEGETIWWTVKEIYIGKTSDQNAIKKVNNDPIGIVAKDKQWLFQGISFPAKVSVYNLLGQKITTASLSQNTIDLHLNAGVYIVNIETADYSVSQKVIVN